MGCKVVVRVTAILALCFELHFGVAIIQHDRRHHVQVLGSNTSPLLHGFGFCDVMCLCITAKAQAHGCILQDLLVLL